MKKLSLLLLLLLTGFDLVSQRVYKKPKFVKNWSKPGKHPDHIVLNFSDDPSTSISVTWRTSKEIKIGYGEIALAASNPAFIGTANTIKANTTNLKFDNVVGVIDRKNPKKTTFNSLDHNYHSVTFKNLKPNTMYGYRVGDGEIWSEWIQFKTAKKVGEPFSFLYVGDAQNYILELWSRLIREGYKKAPTASFIIHAGDLINDAHEEHQWHEWFMAGGWIHRSLPSIPVPGNHEYNPQIQNDIDEGIKRLSLQWNNQFTLPDNGVDGIKETNYYIDYQGVRFIALNSNILIEEQAKWLEKVLSDNPNKWTIATYHHPIFSASRGRDNEILRGLWKPLFDKYNVDLALQGHDHTYTRGRVEPYEVNLVDGENLQDITGTVYVVSVSGGKMYKVKPGWEDYEALRDRVGNNKQLFQVISVDGDKLTYKSYTATGELFDAFDLIKNENGVNSFVERKNEAL
ncbi:MAG: metallophosphoesterase family protein [Bacteroidota bacterium]|nr:metallophosphoesterase family protein [Bacteroidota bacterium]